MLSTAEAVKGLGAGESEALKAVLDELQAASVGVAASLHVAVIAGGTATTPLVVTGIAVGDAVVGVVRLDIAADTGTSATGNKVQDATDLTAEASITAAHVALSTTDTTGDKLVIVWVDKTP